MNLAECGPNGVLDLGSVVAQGGRRELEALALLGVDPADAVVFEDTEAGIASARAAGVGRVLAVRTTLDAHRLGGADELLDRIDLDLMQRLLL